MDETLEKLGYREYRREEEAIELPEAFSLARVVEVHKNLIIVSNGTSTMPAELSGNFLFRADDPIDYPTVGDWVAIQSLENDTHAIAHSVLERKTALKRKSSGKQVEYQLLAANLDYGLVLQPADRFNENLLDRYRVMLTDSGIQPIVLIGKSDLIPQEKIQALLQRLSGLGHPTLALSARTEGGTDALANTLVPNKTYCLLGPSGAGKSSLLNRLLGEELLEVGEVREKDGRGRHTTVGRQLIRLPSGALFIDTPGLRELGNFGVERGIERSFEEIAALARDCRFSDCTHTKEKGCAVLSAVENGEVEEKRYRNFMKLRRESEFYEMSYHEKRKRAKSFGKMVKDAKKVKYGK